MNPGRPQQYNTEAVIDSAMNLFWRQGYEATSMRDLTSQMELSRSSFYQAFGSKHALFLRCIEHYHQVTIGKMQERLDSSESGLDFISRTLTQVITEDNEVTNPRGCLVTNSASEFAQSDAQVASCIFKCLQAYQDIFSLAIAKGREDGSLGHDKDPDLLARFLVSNMSGLRTMLKAGTSREELEKMVEVILDTVS
jgi:TetR/AcrR family transcriptional repressor of nem operon